VKLLDDAAREAELEASADPFAQIVLAHLKALQTRWRDDDRQAWKIRLVRGLYERGLTADDVRQLFGLIDWLIELPAPLDGRFWEEVKQIQEERKMPFLTTPERIGMQKGRREGLLTAIEDLLRARFGEEGLQLLPEIRGLAEEETLRAALRVVGTAPNLEEARQSWKP
jgi:hypothetical protein